MSEIGQMRLETLSGSQLRLLAANLRLRGQDRLAERVERALQLQSAAAARQGPLDADPRPEGAAGHRTVIVTGLAAAVVAGAVAWFVGPRLVQRPEERGPVAAEAPRPRAMAALTPKAPQPQPASEAVQPARIGRPPVPNASHVARETRPQAPPPMAEPPPVGLAESAAPAEAPPAAPVVTAPAATSVGVLAMSRSPTLAAAVCGPAAEGADGLICNDARRAALSGVQARGAPIPVRVAVTPPATARLSARR